MNDSLIEWTSKTWNPITGCPRPKISPGCANCYAERVMNTRLRHLPRYQGDDEPFQALTFHDDCLFHPLKRKKPTRIFVCSMSDLFHELADDEWIAEIFTVMALCPQHTFMLLTKRPERMRAWINDEEDNGGVMLFNALHSVCARAGLDPDAANAGITWPLPNVWLGVTICNQAEAAVKLPVLLQAQAAKRFVSVEPMLGPVEIGKYLYGSYECGLSCGKRLACNDLPEKRCTKCGFTGPDDHATWGDCDCEECPECHQSGCCGEIEEICPDCGHYMVREHPDTQYIDWVICGGETGPGARPMHPDWVRSLRDQCKASRCQPTPFFFKSWGEWLPRSACPDGFDDGAYPWTGVAIRPQTPDSEEVFRIGKRRSGRLLDGCEWNEVPS